MATPKQNDLKNALQTVAGEQPKNQVQDPGKTIDSLLKKMAPEIQRALPAHMKPDRLARIFLTEIRRTPALLTCNQQSLLAAVMQSAQLGLEPGLLGHCYILPYGKEATFIIGYKGMIDLARRSGNIETIYAHVVYKNDHFVLEYGLEEKLEHIPWHLRNDCEPTEDGGIKGFYMMAKFKDGGRYFHYMSKDEIDKHRARSKAANSGPWVTDYVEMGKKTVVRAGWKWLPLSIEIQKAVEGTDETVKTTLSEDMAEVPGVIIEQEYQEVPQDIQDAQQQTTATSQEPEGLV